MKTRSTCQGARIAFVFKGLHRSGLAPARAALFGRWGALRCLMIAVHHCEGRSNEAAWRDWPSRRIDRPVLLAMTGRSARNALSVFDGGLRLFSHFLRGLLASNHLINVILEHLLQSRRAAREELHRQPDD